MDNTCYPHLSIVVPCYNEQEAIPLFLNRISAVAAAMPYVAFEFIFVDDGSHDSTLPIIRELSKEDLRVRYVSFSRNFGKEAAMLAGLETSVGEFIALMDVDLQDPPELLPEMYKAITEDGFDCVATRRTNRKGESPIRSLLSKAFYGVMNKISKTEIVDGARDFRLMTRQVVDAVLSLKEYNRFSKGIFGWIGFRTKWIEYDYSPRIVGRSKWSLWKLFTYAVDGIVDFSAVPLAISSFFGILLFVASFVAVAIVAIRRIIFGDPVDGWASTMCVILFVGGIQLLCTGLLGQYLAKLYLESKQRPSYVVRESGGYSGKSNETGQIDCQKMEENDVGTKKQASPKSSNG